MNSSATESPAMPLSRFRWVGDQLLTSGLVAMEPHGVLAGPFEAQLEHVLSQFSVILNDEGLTASDVVSVDVYLLTMDDFPALNEAFRRFFAPPFPVRTTIVCGLYPGVLVELSMIARAPDVVA